MYLLGAGVICAYGWYKLVLGIREAKYVPLPLTPIPRVGHSRVHR